jgi:phospholipid/cholesterol/gamma-HCH transport system ATP-binding protein
VASHLIDIQGLHKSFGEQQVLRGVDMTIEKGESIVVIGQSGCGKSVLIKHLIRLLEPDAGKVIFDGADISEYDFSELSKLRLRFGMLFQSAALFDSMTVEENVGLGLSESRRYRPKEIKEIVNEKLEMVGLTGANDKRPAELSGGMRKRVGLARAIASSPEVLLYDEPTTGLDPITADMINELIVNLRERLEVTSVAVTHDMKSAFQIADRIIMLHSGRVEFEGTPEEVRTTDNPVVKQFITGSSTGPIRA